MLVEIVGKHTLVRNPFSVGTVKSVLQMSVFLRYMKKDTVVRIYTPLAVLNIKDLHGAKVETLTIEGSENLVICGYCEECFPVGSACKIHERTDTEEEPLKCVYCGVLHNCRCL